MFKKGGSVQGQAAALHDSRAAEAQMENLICLQSGNRQHFNISIIVVVRKCVSFQITPSIFRKLESYVIHCSIIF